MTARQVGEYLAVSEDQVMLFRETAEMEFINVGVTGASHPTWRITRDSVAAFERAHQTTGAK
jgi:ribosomal protein L31